MLDTTEALTGIRLSPDVCLGNNVAMHCFVNLYGCEIGDDTRLGAFVEIQKNAVVGARCKISSHTFICEGVAIEDEVFVGHGVMFINDPNPDATSNGRPKTEAEWEVVPTRVCRGAAIGSGAVIMAGVTIGAGALVGAGAVVTHDVLPGAVVVGVPARFLRSRISTMNGKATNHASATLAVNGPASVPLTDLRGQLRSIGPDLVRAAQEVIESGNYVLGAKVAAFERSFAQYLGAAHCVAVNSGTSALHLALLAAGVRAGDEVITVPMTFVATSWAISYTGARPVFVDVDPQTYTMDVEQVQRRITSRTKAILPVHLYGQPAEMSALMGLAARHGIPLIEDACQAHGARYHGRPVGTFGLCGCFSFYPSKNLGACGEGGAIVTDDEGVAARLRGLRVHAQSHPHHHDELGFNYRMEELQGAVLGVKLAYLEHWTAARQRLAERYTHLLEGMSLNPPAVAPGRRSAWHLYVVLLRERDRVRQALAARGVQTGLHYPTPVHLQKAYAELEHRRGDFPVAERIADECLSLPLFPEMTEEQQDTVVETLCDVLQEESWR